LAETSAKTDALRVLGGNHNLKSLRILDRTVTIRHDKSETLRVKGCCLTSKSFSMRGFTDLKTYPSYELESWKWLFPCRYKPPYVPVTLLVGYSLPPQLRAQLGWEVVSLEVSRGFGGPYRPLPRILTSMP